MQFKRSLAIGSAVLVLASGASLAWAAIPDPAGVIHGCRNNLFHSVTVVDSATQTCPAGSTALDWNQTGPQGPMGPVGPVGPQGAGSSLYRVTSRSAALINAGDTSSSVVVGCNGSDFAIAGGYGFDTNSLSAPPPGSTTEEPAGEFSPQQIQIREDRVVFAPNPINAVYEVDATFAAYVPDPNPIPHHGPVYLVATVSCSHPIA